MTDKSESRCSKECSYMFFECEADRTLGGECLAHYNDCIEECAATWPRQDAAPV
jgi:hypothetical protein